VVMKELDPKQVPAVSGGEMAPGPFGSGELLPPAPVMPDYPQNPARIDPAHGPGHVEQ